MGRREVRERPWTRHGSLTGLVPSPKPSKSMKGIAESALGIVLEWRERWGKRIGRFELQ
jgi:hypothetical protein